MKTNNHSMKDDQSTFYVKKNLIDKINFSEIDFDLYTELGFDPDKEGDFEEIEDHFQDTGSTPINIDRMIGALTSLKNSGSTHVEITDNPDSIGYSVYGYEIRPADEEEIRNFTDAKSREDEIKLEKRISYLKHELYKLIKN